MRRSSYFSELSRAYADEVDDLLTDSDGKHVLQKRLNVKRQEIESILPMISFSPEMVAVAFYDAFAFASPETMDQVVMSEPGMSGFLSWSELTEAVTIAEWAKPLVDASLKVDGGEDFLVSTATLEFLRTHKPFSAPAPDYETESRRHDHDDEHDDDAHDLSEAGADWLTEQGFETLDR